MDEDTQEQIQLINGIGFSGVPVCLTYAVVFILSGHTFLGLWFLLGIPIFAISTYMINILGYKVCRIVMCIFIPLFWLTVTVMFGRECGFYLGFIVISFPPLLFFPTVRKAIPFVAWSVLCLIGSIVLLGVVDQPTEIEFWLALYYLNLGVVLMTTFIVISIFREQIIENRLIVREQKREIIDSINYAARIQAAALPMQSIKAKLFPNSFVLFLPKDIVSGDFYWFGEKNGKNLIAAIDCTGHGVPGAFMSMIGNSFLNEIVLERGTTEPAIILDKLRAKIIRTLAQDESGPSQKDGMDMALLSFDNSTGTVEFAGAKNPLYYIRGGELNEIKGDKMPIGEEAGEHRDFTNHQLELQSGDVYYLFTDGYPDQFGGPRGKKYKYSNFKKLIMKHHQLQMSEQESLLLEEFTDWKASFEQLDDVCVIGVKV
ncbi:SpoIIE family protein phosphatase [Crocinitomix catalasitica]|nr:SpoIIE family protein phosphatase [Crocinitomix catalasitica]